MPKSNLPTETMIFLLDGLHGIYLPQMAIKEFDLDAWNLNGPDAKDMIASLTAGPEDPYYWDSWDWVVNKARYIHKGDPARDHPESTRYLSGVWTWHVGESGDLFAVHESHDFHE